MKSFRNAIAYFTFFALLAVVLLSACSNSVITAPSPVAPSNTVETITETTTLPDVKLPSPPAILPDTRIEVVYFHMPYRCGACICMEEQAAYVVETYFQEELASGKLVFHICDLGDRNKAPLFRKYDAFGSQLFVNTIIDNADHIRDIREIWSWNCERDKQGFDDRVKNAIEHALKEIG